jgi:predicted Zn-dependent protease
MRRIATLCFALATLALLPAAFAEVKTHAAAGVEMDVPAGWKAEAHSDDLMTIQDPKDEVGIMLIVLDAKDFKKAVAAVDTEIGKVAKNIKWEHPEPKQIKLNGMDAIANGGTAVIEGKPADIGVLVAKTPSGKLLLVFGAVESAKKSAHQSEIDGFMSSIKPHAADHH